MARVFQIYWDLASVTSDAMVAGTPPNWSTPNPQTRPLSGYLRATLDLTDIDLSGGYAEDGAHNGVGTLPANFVVLTAFAKIGSISPTGAGYTWELSTTAADPGQTVSENDVTVTYQSPPPTITELSTDTISLDFVLGAAATLQFGVAVNNAAGGGGLEKGVYGTYTLLRADSTAGGAPSTVPAHGPVTGGTSFTILGYDFSSGTPTVTVDGVSATGVTVDDDLTITCIAPAAASAAGLKDVVVTINGIEATVTNGFLYDGTWYYNPVTDHYKFATTDPGAPWTQNDPVLTDESVVPTEGSTLGGD